MLRSASSNTFAPPRRMNWSFPNASEFDVQGSALRSRLSELFHSIKLNPCGGFEAEMAQAKTPMNKKNMDKS